MANQDYKLYQEAKRAFQQTQHRKEEVGVELAYTQLTSSVLF
jgi:hypothetical protein